MNTNKKHRFLSASFIALLVASSTHASTYLNEENDGDLTTSAPRKKSGEIEAVEEIEIVDASPTHQNEEEVSITNLTTVAPEIVSHIFSFLDGVDVVAASNTCKYLKDVGQEHRHYMARTVNDYVSFQSLYGADLKSNDVLTREKVAAERAMITHLEISDKDRKIGRIDLAHILKLTPHVRVIKVRDAELVAPSSASDASTSPQVSFLESLELSNCKIKPDAAHANIAEALRATGAYVANLMINNALHFRNLKIKGIPGFFTNHVLPSLRANEHFKDVNDKASNPFKAFKRLEILGDGQMTELPAEFSLFEGLKVLRLSGAHVQSVAQAKEGFEYFPNLEVLEVKNNNPQKRQEGIENLLKAAGHSKALRTLTLENVGVTKFHSGSKDLLAPFTLLENFYLEGNDSLSILPKALYESKTLKRVVVKDSALDGFDHSFESPLIKHVDFSNNPALHGAPTFEHPDAIEFLNFEGMPVQPRGWFAFFKQQWESLVAA